MSEIASIIPEMTDRLGKYWEQPPDIREAPMDAEIVLLTLRQFEGLHEYSSSIPSGVYPGKCWKRLERDRPYLGWYGVCDDPERCSVNFRKIEVVSP